MPDARWQAAGPKRPVIAPRDHRRSDQAAQKRQAPAWPSFHDMVSRLEALERAPVFFSLPEPTLRALARRVRRISVAAGEMVISQGEPGDTIFFIERGRCRVMIERPPGVVTVAVLSEGDMFGEGATLLHRPQQASVYAQTDGYLLALDRQSLHSVLMGNDSGALAELTRLAEQRYNTFADTSVQATWGMLLEEGTVVGVYSPKGGSGGTSISLNLVGALARRHPGEVLLLDLDFPYSHSALLAGLVPSTCLARLAGVSADSLEEVLLSAILYHPGGPMILPGALRPEEADAVTPELVNRAIAILRKTFRYIIVDLGVTITDATLALFDLTQHVVLVTVPEMSAVKSASDAIEILMQLGTPDDRLTVVLNNRSIKPAVTMAAVERAIKRKVNLEVAFDGGRAEQAAVEGVILTLTNTRTEVARGAEELAALLESTHGRGHRNAGPSAASIGISAPVGEPV
jgi:MinD-like ATPase involved in chromosome partitioning or flagellar assembly